jgi:hypothetical protein
MHSQASYWFSIGFKQMVCTVATCYWFLALLWFYKTRSFLSLEHYNSARIYRPSFGHENGRFHEHRPKTLVFNSIRTQRRRFLLVLDEIRFGGSFRILGLRRGRDQLVFIPKERPY